jgi:hypothetical protein
MTRTPQLILTLSPENSLVVELPGVMGTRRRVELRPGSEAETLTRILRAQREEKAEIGLDGAPTQAQVRHWERHSIWSDSRCRFCIAEGKASPAHSAKPTRRSSVIERRPDGVEIKKLRAGASGLGPKPSGKSAEEMGL